MDKYQVCPTCQRRNAPNVPLCAYCGTPLSIDHHQPVPTTKAVPGASFETKPDANGCASLLPQLATNSLALLVKGMHAPIVLHEVTFVVLGRGDAPPGVSFVDLSEIGDMAMGVSRQHARLTYEDGRFWLEDMHSTNGSWLNQQRISPGVPYLLACHDAIWLGPVKLIVCLPGSGESSGQEPDSAFTQPATVTSRSEPPTPAPLAPIKQVRLTLIIPPESALGAQSVSPTFLAAHIVPYLRGIEGLQQVIEACQGKTAVALQLHSLDVEKEGITLTLSTAAEIVPLLHTLITPWRRRHLSLLSSGELTEAEGDDLLAKTAQQIIQLVAPQLKPGEQAKRLQAMLPSLKAVATSALEAVPSNRVRETFTWDSSRD